jgi:transposase InsO family protein
LQDFRGYAIETLQAETVETRQCTSYVDLELNSPAYLPVLKGHFYLVAIMDWFSHKVLSWRISNTMDVQFCIEALEAALSRYHQPTIFNSDQGAQFTANAFTDCLKRSDIQTQ